MEAPAQDSIIISIGKSSDGISEEADLQDLPHLFLSYSEVQQLNLYLLGLIEQWNQRSEFTYQLATATTNECYHLLQDVSLTPIPVFSYIRNNPEKGTTKNKAVFIQTLFKELNRRKKKKDSKASEVIDFDPLIVLIDDLLEMLINKRKSTGLRFLQVLIEGPSVRIHAIAASGRAFSNLLNQLININPSIKEQLQQQVPDINLSYRIPLGAELILTPEDLFFFKTRYQSDYQRFYALEPAKPNTHEER